MGDAGDVVGGVRVNVLTWHFLSIIKPLKSKNVCISLIEGVVFPFKCTTV